jgi:hypothetical protein
MVLELGLSAIVPPIGSVPRLPLPSTGSREGRGSPASPVLRAAPTPCRPPPCFVAFARPYRSPSRPAATGPPRFLGNPHVHAPLSDPGGSVGRDLFGAAPLLVARRRCLPPFRRRRPHHTHPFEAPSRGLHTRCLRFAATVTRGPRKTGFSATGSRRRAGLEPAGLRREVSAGPATPWLPPHPGLSWRTEKDVQGPGAPTRPRPRAGRIRSSRSYGRVRAGAT